MAAPSSGWEEVSEWKPLHVFVSYFISIKIQGTTDLLDQARRTKPSPRLAVARNSLISISLALLLVLSVLRRQEDKAEKKLGMRNGRAFCK